MELQDFIRSFAQQLDDTDIKEITAECKFRELDEWSSLTALSIIAFVKTDYNKDITGMEIRSCQTVKDLFELAKSK